MTSIRAAFLVIIILGFMGCYHASIETGLAPSNVTIHETFASSWIYGLVPPSTIATASKCPDGVAKVETQLSFVNQLVGMLTFGIYTPMEIKVTCAAKSTAMSKGAQPEFVLPAGATVDEIRQIYMAAASMAVETGKAVYVEY